MKVALAQIAPVFLDREATLARMTARVAEAAGKGAEMVCFGETLLPGYPFWLGRTDGARFDDPDQKRLHALYLDAGVDIEAGDMAPLQAAAASARATVVTGVAERPAERGGHTIYCSRVFIGPEGQILSVHRKLMPTYEERLSWGTGDGAGLVVHQVGPFTAGGLNCWENWMPLARAALYASGMDLYVMLWPGARRLTEEISRFVARESRSYVLGVGALLRESDLPAELPLRERMGEPGETFYDGGSCIAGPDGEWLVEPVTGHEELIVADLDPAKVREERQNFDPSGHYARPDVLRLVVDRRRQAPAEFMDD
jgi:nitrilase